MYYLYIIKSLIKTWHYIGITSNIERRLIEHNTGKTKSTSPYKPFVIIYTEKFSSMPEARVREVYLKKTAKAREQLYKEFGAIV